MSDDSANAEPSIEEQLVAYLDGELDAETSRGIEERLANEPRLRQSLQQLDRAWDLLGELDTPGVADTFTQTTLEMVTTAAAEDVQRSREDIPRRRRRRWAVVTGGLLAAGLAGFLATYLLVPDPNEALIRDLPVLENLDQYALIDDVEFLQMLDQQGLFVEENGQD